MIDRVAYRLFLAPVPSSPRSQSLTLSAYSRILSLDSKDERRYDRCPFPSIFWGSLSVPYGHSCLRRDGYRVNHLLTRVNLLASALHSHESHACSVSIMMTLTVLFSFRTSRRGREASSAERVESPTASRLKGLGGVTGWDSGSLCHSEG